MKSRNMFWLLITVTLCMGQDNLRDIKFYNLEKEYTKTVTFVYKVKNAKALELKQIVDDMLSIYGNLYVNDNSNELYITDTEEKIADLKGVVSGLDIADIKAGNNLVSKCIYLKHENVSEVLEIIKHKISPDGVLNEVPTLNALVVTDVASKIREVEDLLKKIDIPIPHIAIEITIVEFNNEYFSKLGINVFNWLQGLSVGASAGFGGPGKAHLNAAIGNGARSVNTQNEQSVTSNKFDAGNNSRVTSQVGKQTFISANFNIGDIAGFISENADGSVLASTRVITRNNKEARVEAMERIPFRFPDDKNTQYFNGNAEAQAGISMQVRPTLQLDSMINLRIVPTIADLTGWGPAGQPIVFQRSLNTEVKVPNNNIFVLGGLKKKESVNVRRGIPLLKDIPILGYLFSIRQKVTLEREVLILIRPSTQANTSLSKESFDNLMKRYKEVNK